MTDEQTEAVLAQMTKKSRVTIRIGRYVGSEFGQALVDMGDQRFPCAWRSSGFVPEINEAVWVESIDGQLYMTGPTTPKPGLGVVSVVAAPLVTVVTDFGTFTMPYTGDLPGSGDPVAITWSEGPKCAKLSVNPDPGEQPAPPGGVGQVFSGEFRAIDAGSTDRPPKAARWWSARPMASASTYGAWFYGSQLKDSIPASAQFVSLEIYVTWAIRRYPGPPRWVLHNLATKSGMPTVSGYTGWEPGNAAGWHTPPDAEAWFDGLKAGGSWWGIGLDQGGHEAAKSLVEDGQSGALRIKWKV